MPVSKRLVCGDVGLGAMAEVPTLVEAVRAECVSLGERGTFVAATMTAVTAGTSS